MRYQIYVYYGDKQWFSAPFGEDSYDEVLYGIIRTLNEEHSFHMDNVHGSKTFFSKGVIQQAVIEIVGIGHKEKNE